MTDYGSDGHLHWPGVGGDAEPGLVRVGDPPPGQDQGDGELEAVGDPLEGVQEQQDADVQLVALQPPPQGGLAQMPWEEGLFYILFILLYHWAHSFQWVLFIVTIHPVLFCSDHNKQLKNECLVTKPPRQWNVLRKAQCAILLCIDVWVLHKNLKTTIFFNDKLIRHLQGTTNCRPTFETNTPTSGLQALFCG